jgi:hypothetical protein
MRSNQYKWEARTERTVTFFAPLNFLGGGDSNFSVLLCFALLVEVVLGGMQNAVIEGWSW